MHTRQDSTSTKEDAAVFLHSHELWKNRKKRHATHTTSTLATDRPLSQTIRTNLPTLQLGHDALRRCATFCVCPRFRLPGETHTVQISCRTHAPVFPWLKRKPLSASFSTRISSLLSPCTPLFTFFCISFDSSSPIDWYNAQYSISEQRRVSVFIFPQGEESGSPGPLLLRLHTHLRTPC